MEERGDYKEEQKETKIEGDTKEEIEKQKREAKGNLGKQFATQLLRLTIVCPMNYLLP